MWTVFQKQTALQTFLCNGRGSEKGATAGYKEPNGDFNEKYYKWCYSDGEFKYTSKEQLIEFCVEHMANEKWPAEQVRAHMEAVVPKLNHWK